ncbi:helix-turn-helix domain-containing protein [Roseospirillum parvum]|uniref:Uncharacterized protein n=1 Tax=Roseospirillum parvum TaxID=83401 RepID=A0A1G8G6N1_9PROT|nr:LysR family transcriptional regulator [Roseospirillum parvum]SDH90088.1 hypothetical protein SAMN05421742_1209 [Roseospirillum parvum]
MTDGADHDWLALLRADVARSGSIAATARRLGISRPAVSGVLHGTYRAGTHQIRERVLGMLAVHPCPALAGQEISGTDCAARAARAMPTSSAAALRAWAACRTCPRHPDQRRKDGNNAVSDLGCPGG